MILETTIYNCTCYVGWTGLLCETDIDTYEPDKFSSCNQIGTAMCVDGNSTHSCECLSGFTGDLCSVAIVGCDPDPCANNTMFPLVNLCVNVHRGSLGRFVKSLVTQILAKSQKKWALSQDFEKMTLCVFLLIL